MSVYTKPITEIIQNRFSCRSYLKVPVDSEKQQMLQAFISDIRVGPLNTSVRYDLLAAENRDRKALRGLGTYGLIKDAAGFVVGAMGPGNKNLEDYGYRLEQIVLYLTDLGLGTCWLGGNFTRSSFARKIGATTEERLPAVIALGIIADEAQARQSAMRQSVGADTRLPWENLFFDGKFGASLSRQKAGPYALLLENLRLGPSASNKQPWRVIQAGNAFHFYLQRTKGYPPALVKTVLQIEDLQRVDLGIAMCHFELTASELGLLGCWMVQEPPINKPDALCEYTVSWEID
ncbi:MAG TPA: nitroreductase family protein [Anaerolineaceae bacterium]|nr:nitroreductase family protein [Anaerolineaceae bacterium]